MKSIKKIALVSSAPLSITRVPAGLAFMAGICEHNHVDYEIFDLNIGFLKRHGETIYEQVFESVAFNKYNHAGDLPAEHRQLIEDYSVEVCNTIKQDGYDAVAMTVLSFQQSFWTVFFLNILKQTLPHITVIVGGPGVSTTNMLDPGNKASLGKYLVDQNLADCYVLGEGDILFGEFLMGRAMGQPGFNVRGSEETWQPQINDMDATPLPSYKKVQFSDYKFAYNKPEVTLTASRGCVRDCTFCDVGYFWKKFRFRSGPRVAEEMYKSYTEMGITDFWFNDSLMNGSFKQFFELMECLKKLQDRDPGFAKIKYGGQLILRPKNTHTEQMYSMLGETGGKFFQVGIESGSEAVRDHMRKKFSNEDIYYHYEMSARFKIQNWIFMTVGYPTETEKDFQDTLDLYTNLQKYLIDDTIVGTGVAGPVLVLPNTPLASMMDELDIHYIEDETLPGQWTSNHAGGLTTEIKYLRYVRLTRHILGLGYRMPHEFPIKVKQQTQYFLSKQQEPVQDTGIKAKKTIPIIAVPHTVLS